jgi:hypothetical protein
MTHPAPLDIRILSHGLEQEPVLVIDDFLPDPDALIAHAATLAYRPIGPHYPGVRAPASAEVVAALVRPVADVLRQTFGPMPAGQIDCFYSLVTTPPAQLKPIQRLPHFDGLGRERIAMLLHLGRAERGGTAFFRHRATGFETMTAERFPTFQAALHADVARLGLPPPAYIAGDTPIFEQIAHHEARFNRMLIYRGSALHCGDIPPDLTLTADPRTGRFSVNLFIFPAAAPGPGR